VVHNSLALVDVEAGRTVPPGSRATKGKQPTLILQRPRVSSESVQFLWRIFAGGDSEEGVQGGSSGSSQDFFVPISHSSQENGRSDDASRDDEEFYWVISGLAVMNCTAATAAAASGFKRQPSKNEGAQLLLLAHRVRPATHGSNGGRSDGEASANGQHIVTDNLKFDVLGTVLLVVRNALDPPLQWRWYDFR
jgi:hypothetical protein